MIKTIPQRDFNIRPMSEYASKSHNSISIQQSPKISSKKFRNIIIESPNSSKLFSLRDINLKKTNQRGTELPQQYIRRNEEELKQLLTSNNYYSSRNEKNPIKAFNKEFPSFDERKVSNNETKKLSSNNNEKTEKKIKRPQSASLPNSKMNMKKDNLQNETSNKKNNNRKRYKNRLIKYIPIHTESDRYLPKGYLDYYKFVTNPDYYKEIVETKIKGNTPLYKSVNYKEIKSQALKSDILMQKPVMDRKELNYNAFRDSHKTNVIYMQSDIFHRKNNLSDFEKKKMGEKFLFKSELAKNKISNIANSNSEWVDKKTNVFKTTNLPSTQYNIIAPGRINTIPIKKDINIYNKTKGLDEFIHLTRVTAANPNLDYVQKIKENPFAFRKVKEICSDYLESYSQGKSILSKPF
jgi:hypothetical protein